MPTPIFALRGTSITPYRAVGNPAYTIGKADALSDVTVVADASAGIFGGSYLSFVQT